MKTLMRSILVCVFSLFIFLACKKTETTPGSDHIPVIEQPDSTVMAGLQGRVTDENGSPVKDAIITSGANSTTTDVNGTFNFASIPISHFYGFVKAQKAGYFTGSRTILTSTKGSNYVEIKLFPRTIKGSFDAAEGASIEIESGSSVVFPAAAIVNASTHASYTGMVKVFASWLDPTDPELNKHMPGDLRGTDKDNKNVGLQTYGMLNVELEGASGEKLQIADGQTAAIYLPIPASMQASAPATIPLWYFNDTTGKWIEQGTATKKDNLYCGQTSHFTYWNCDVPRDLIYFTATIQDAKNNPLANTTLMITEGTSGDTRGGYSDASGSVSGWIFKNAVLTFNIYDHCGNSLASIPEGPFTTDQDLGILTASTEQAQTVTFTGTVVDCSNAAVSNGFVSIKLDGLQYAAAVTAGSFNTTILRCTSTATTATVIAGDYATTKESAEQSFDVNGSTVSTGVITACAGSFDQFIHFSFSGNNYSITVPPDSITINPGSGYTLIAGIAGNYGDAKYKNISFQSASTSAGTFPLGYISFYVGQEWYSNKSADPLSITYTTYDPYPTGYVEGNISGNVYMDSTGAALPFTGNFRVKER